MGPQYCLMGDPKLDLANPNANRMLVSGAPKSWPSEVFCSVHGNIRCAVPLQGSSLSLADVILLLVSDHCGKWLKVTVALNTALHTFAASCTPDQLPSYVRLVRADVRLSWISAVVGMLPVVPHLGCLFSYQLSAGSIFV